VVFETYRDLLVAVATASGALTGLLFVALSLGPGRVTGPPVIRQIRAAAGRPPALPAGAGGSASGNLPEHEATGHQPDEPGV
jgi:hypothetical protein